MAATRPASPSTRITCCRIPKGIPLERAAPLLCAGITTYSPLKHFGVEAGDKLARGRPGRPRPHGGEVRPRHGRPCHRAQPLAGQARGRARARRRRLPRHAATRRCSRRMPAASISSSTRSRRTHDYNAYLDLLRRDGIMVLVGRSASPTPLAAFPLIMKRRSLAGSLIGGIRETQEMLDFCARARRCRGCRGDPDPGDQRGLRAHAQERRALPFRDRPRQPEIRRSLAAQARGHRPSFCTASRKGGRTLESSRMHVADLRPKRVIASKRRSVRLVHCASAFDRMCDLSALHGRRGFITRKLVYECGLTGIGLEWMRNALHCVRGRRRTSRARRRRSLALRASISPFRLRRGRSQALRSDEASPMAAHHPSASSQCAHAATSRSAPASRATFSTGPFASSIRARTMRACMTASAHTFLPRQLFGEYVRQRFFEAAEAQSRMWSSSVVNAVATRLQSPRAAAIGFDFDRAEPVAADIVLLGHGLWTLSLPPAMARSRRSKLLPRERLDKRQVDRADRVGPHHGRRAVERAPRRLPGQGHGDLAARTIAAAACAEGRGAATDRAAALEARVGADVGDRASPARWRRRTARRGRPS